jgi:small subunit ribosomal protein S16
MVRIRLRRTGMKGQSSYRIVVADIESPRDGRFIEIVGSYNPRTNPSTVNVKEDRVYDWMLKGAQPSESVVKIFTSIGLMERWARVKGGEAVETVLAEAQTSAEGRVISPKTHVKTPEKK